MYSESTNSFSSILKELPAPNSIIWNEQSRAANEFDTCNSFGLLGFYSSSYVKNSLKTLIKSKTISMLMNCVNYGIPKNTDLSNGDPFLLSFAPPS